MSRNIQAGEELGKIAAQDNFKLKGFMTAENVHGFVTDILKQHVSTNDLDCIYETDVINGFIDETKRLEFHDRNWKLDL